MTGTQQEQQQFASDLVGLISLAFTRAYSAHAFGLSEDALLIDYDIEAAAFNQDKNITRIMRDTIKSAVSAVDQRVPYPIAHAYLMKRVVMYIKHAVD